MILFFVFKILVVIGVLILIMLWMMNMFLDYIKILIKFIFKIIG